MTCCFEKKTVVLALVLVICGCERHNESANSPIASFQVTPLIGSTETLFTVDASESTDEETPPTQLEVRWDWENDGNYDTEWSTTKTDTHLYPLEDYYVIQLQVRDEDGLIDEEGHSIVVSSEGELCMMTLIPAGSFMMGGNDGEYDEQPSHEVTLTHDFYLGTHEVTNEEYVVAVQWAYYQGIVAASNSTIQAYGEELLNLDHVSCEISFSDGVFYLDPVHAGDYNDQASENHPVKLVSWYGAACFCDWVSIMTGLESHYNGDWSIRLEHSPYNAEGYTLPTEAEWEYAAGYDDDRVYPWGDETPDCDYANFMYNDDLCVGWTAPVGCYLTGNSQLGISDFGGNVWELLNDWYDSEYYHISSGVDPTGPSSSSSRVIRGGGWYNGSYNHRCEDRTEVDPSGTFSHTGFRICRRVQE